MMNHFLRRGLCLLLLLGLLVSGGGLTAFAEDEVEVEAELEEEAGPHEIRVYADGLLGARAYDDGDDIYLPLENLCSLLGFDCICERDSESDVLLVSAYGLHLESDPAEDYFSVNGRYVYNPTGFPSIDGHVCIPVEAAARVFSLDWSLSEDRGQLDLDLSHMDVLYGGPGYYSDTYGSENVFWLIQIINAEATHQPLDGRIGVGNVVLNRVDSDMYPDNIYDVIFDYQFGVQFEPAYNGRIYLEPNELSEIAAYLCLEGYNTVGESMFFVCPFVADDTWFRLGRTYVTSLGAHDFYA